MVNIISYCKPSILAFCEKHGLDYNNCNVLLYLQEDFYKLEKALDKKVVFLELEDAFQGRVPVSRRMQNWCRNNGFILIYEDYRTMQTFSWA